MRERGSSRRGVGVGMASVLMIVVVLALTTFGVLSLVSAQADAGMSRRAVETVRAYYAAEGRIQGKLAELDAAFLSGESSLLEGETVVLKEEVQEGQELILELKRAEEGQEGRFEILRYGLENTDAWSPDESLEIWDGGR